MDVLIITLGCKGKCNYKGRFKGKILLHLPLQIENWIGKFNLGFGIWDYYDDEQNIIDKKTTC